PITANRPTLRRIEFNDPTKSRGKLASNYEWSYRLIEVVQEGTYHLRTTYSVMLPRIWYIVNLKKYYP
ncbi:hypothetical protein B296_00012480, partial [Ensete ventricosum]